jgi:hypothetical protein
MSKYVLLLKVETIMRNCMYRDRNKQSEYIEMQTMILEKIISRTCHAMLVSRNKNLFC